MLEQMIHQYRLPLEETMPLFATLLSVPLPDYRYPPLSLAPQRLKQKTLETLLAILLEQAAEHPTLLIVEDLHWVDPTTVEWLSLVIDQIPTTSLCLLMTCRPEFQSPWGSRSYLTQMTLNRLPRAQVAQMVELLADRAIGGTPFPTDAMQHLVEKSDGIPLFIEEMTKTVLESAILTADQGEYVLTGPVSAVAIPATLQDSLMARLDRLVTAKGIAQLGATLGRHFSYALLQAVAQLDEETLQRELQRLVTAELLYQRGVPPQATYLFKHALIQDVAYQSLLKSTRQQYHQKVAQVLEGQFPEVAATQPEVLAQHYTEAGLAAPAIHYWQRAGQRAIERSAYQEALSHLRTGIEVLSTLPDTAERTRQELLLQMTLGPVWIALKGYAAPEVEQAYARARTLCHHVGDTPQFFPVLRGLWWFSLLRGELQTARELGEQLLSLAQRVHDPALLLEAHYALGNTLNYLGELAAAQASLVQGIALYDRQQHSAHTLLYSQDPGVACLSYAAQTLWLLGYPEQALQRSHEALTLAQEVAHPLSLAYALFFAAWLHQLRREVPLAQARSEAVISLAAEHGFVHWGALGTVLRGWICATQGQAEEGMAQIYQGLAAWQATGARGVRPLLLALLAEAYEQGEQAEEGLRALTKALAEVEHTGERRHEAELYRLKGALLLAQSVDHTAEAEACFHRALDVARCQQAKSLELRAAMSLARLWQGQGKRTAAYELLAPVYNWFTEGFDTADLQEAKTLLDALSEEGTRFV
jgi:predicted ATPase